VAAPTPSFQAVQNPAVMAQRKQAGCIVAFGGLMSLFTMFQLARVLAQEPAADVGMIVGAAVGVVIGLAVVVLGITKLARAGR